MMKYSSHHVVQLARICGESQGIENVRKRRLDKEPDGFFLDVNEGPYTCSVCSKTAPGNRIWWTPDGLTCVDCRRNIREGVIPDLTKAKDNTWFQDWQVVSEYGIHPKTREKLEREGVLRGRKLKSLDGSAYHTIYLVSENEEFLKKYPKKLSPIDNMGFVE